MTTYIKNILAYFFGDYSTAKVLPASTETVSAAIDFQHVMPGRSTITLVITGSTGGDIEISTSTDGVSGWAVSHTESYTAAGTVSIFGITALNGSALFARVSVTDTSGIAGTITGSMTGQS